MATLRIALVLVCLMAVGATNTCPDGADSETCSQLDAASLIQLPATATVSQANVAAKHLGASRGQDYIACGKCMGLLKKCIASLGGQTDDSNPAMASGAELAPNSAVADNPDAAPVSDAVVEPDRPCEEFDSALNDQTPENAGKARSYQTVLCILGNSECDGGDDVLNGPAACYVQLMAMGMPNFEFLCPSDEASNDSSQISGALGLTQKKATRELKRDESTCINPNKDDPAEWYCSCMDDMRDECSESSDSVAEEQACFKRLMCADDRIHKDWKSGNCEEGAGGCQDDALLVETNTSMEARVKEGTPSQALDDSLSGKRTC